MKYFSLDIETTGTDVDTHQIVEIGGVVDDLEDPKPIDDLPEFHCYVTHDTYNVSEYVLGMHTDSGIWKRLQNRTKGFDYLSPDQAVEQLAKFIYQNYISKDERAKHPIDGTPVKWDSALNPEMKWSSFVPLCFPMKVVAAGKNFGSFDLQFLKTLPDISEYIRFQHRVLDPGPLYTKADDRSVPSMDECLKRAGFDEVVPHNAVDDSKLVVRLIRNHFDIEV